MGSVISGLTGQGANANSVYGDAERNALQRAAMGAQSGMATNLGQQQNFADLLRAQAMGQGGPAQTILNQATGQNIRQAAGLIGAQKGISNALAQRNAADVAGQANQQAAGQAALNQLQAQNAYGQALGNIGQGFGQMGNFANQGTGAAQQLAQAQMQQQGQVVGGALGGLGSWAGLAGVGKAAMAEGGTVPGFAQEDGDSYENDTVDAKLSPGEIVVPRSAAQDPASAAQFAAGEASNNHISSLAKQYEMMGVPRQQALMYASQHIQKLMGGL